jgi:hypothetical protein
VPSDSGFNHSIEEMAKSPFACSKHFSVNDTWTTYQKRQKGRKFLFQFVIVNYELRTGLAQMVRWLLL